MRLTQSVQRLKGDINQAVRNWLIVIYDGVWAVGQGPNIVFTGGVDTGSQTLQSVFQAFPYNVERI